MSTSRYKVNPLVLIGVPTLESRPLTWEWMDYYMALRFPLGAAVGRMRIEGKTIFDARNLIVEEALRGDCDYVLFLSDDVLAPPNMFNMLWRHREAMVTGVYWTKDYPHLPYLWNGILKGPYVDWKVGEYFPIDFAGCDALLVNTEVFRAIDPPWFSQYWTFEEEQDLNPILTEDFYFYTKAKQAGFTLWCDSAVQCDHIDRKSGQRFGLTVDMPQAQQDAPHCDKTEMLVADIGAGFDSPWLGPNAKIRRYDINPGVHPDVVCDVRAIPEKDNIFDMVVSKHVLEHFTIEESMDLLREWMRILKPGGNVWLSVPNIAHAATEILKAVQDENYDAGLYPLWQLYGKQVGAFGEVHRNGFTIHGLKRLMTACGLADVEVKEGDFVNGMGLNLYGKGRKADNVKPLAIAPALREVEERDNG